MKITQIKNIPEFLKRVQTCSGNVILSTMDGDVLNLKSTLSKYIAANDILSKITINGEVDIEFENPEDILKVVYFIL